MYGFWLAMEGPGIGISIGGVTTVGVRIDRGLRNLWDSILLLTPSAKMSVYLNVDYLHDSPKLTPAFTEVRRVLQPGGSFCFALFGAGTLAELRESYRWAICHLGRGQDRTLTFHGPDAVATALASAGFTDCRVWCEQEEEEYPDVPDLLRAVRGIGAGTTHRVRGGSLAERRVMLTMMEHYREVYGRDGRIPASYAVIYGTARHP